MIRPRSLHTASRRAHGLLLSALALAVLSACSSVPDSNANLNGARASYRQAQDDGTTRELAGAEMKQAADALAAADVAFSRGDSATEVDHLAYLARQRVAVAQEIARRKSAERSVVEATAARDQVRLAARTRQADAATAATATAQREASAAQMAAAAAQQQSAAAQQQSALSQQQSALSQQQARDSQSRSAELEAQLAAMNARKTERGIVVTIGDVLFDNNESMLRPEGMRSIDKLVSFLGQHPQRKAAIEGFTDSVGNDSSNRALSDRRAQSVRTALVDRGIGRERLSTQGYGERYPVASNESADGRQLNRRVEIVLSDDQGLLTPR